MDKNSMEELLDTLAELGTALEEFSKKFENYRAKIGDLRDQVFDNYMYQNSSLGKLQGQVQRLSEQLSRMEMALPGQTLPNSEVATGVSDNEPSSYQERPREQGFRLHSRSMPSSVANLEAEVPHRELSVRGFSRRTDSGQAVIETSRLEQAAIRQAIPSNDGETEGKDSQFEQERENFLKAYYAGPQNIPILGGIKLAVKKSDREKLARIRKLEQWTTFPEADNICLEDGVGEVKYSAKELSYRGKDGYLYYLVLPIKGASFNKDTIITNAYIAFFDFALEKIPDSDAGNVQCKQLEPAIFRKVDNTYRLVQKGKLEF